MPPSDPFYRKLLERQHYEADRNLAKSEGAKEFADMLNKAREKDALEFLAQAQTSIAGLSNEDAKRTMTVLAVNKLFDVGYREFALLFKQVLQRSE